MLVRLYRIRFQIINIVMSDDGQSRRDELDGQFDKAVSSLTNVIAEYDIAHAAITTIINGTRDLSEKARSRVFAKRREEMYGLWQTIRDLSPKIEHYKTCVRVIYDLYRRNGVQIEGDKCRIILNLICDDKNIAFDSVYDVHSLSTS